MQFFPELVSCNLGGVMLTLIDRCQILTPIHPDAIAQCQLSHMHASVKCNWSLL